MPGALNCDSELTVYSSLLLIISLIQAHEDALAIYHLIHKMWDLEIVVCNVTVRKVDDSRACRVSSSLIVKVLCTLSIPKCPCRCFARILYT